MNGREDALQLFQKNSQLAPWILNKYFHSLIPDDDLLQEAYTGLWKACLNYNEEKSKFATFANRCIRNQIVMELRKRKRNRKNYPVVLSMDALITDGEDATFEELIEDRKLSIESQGIFLKDFISHLDEREQKIVYLSMLGLKGTEASKLLGLSQPWYSEIFRRIKRKYIAYCKEEQ